MQQSEFEKQVQQKLQELNFVPAEDVWQKIEAKLPEKKKRRYAWFILLPLLLTGVLTVLYFSIQNNTGDIPASNNEAIAYSSENSLGPLAQNAQIQDNNLTGNKIDSSVPAKTTTENGSSHKSPIDAKVDIVSSVVLSKDDLAAETTIIRKKVEKSRSETALSFDYSIPEIAATERGKQNSPFVDVPTNDANVINNSIDRENISIIKVLPGDISTLGLLKRNNAIGFSEIGTLQQSVKDNKSGKWDFNIQAMAGKSTAKAELFSNSNVYLADRIGQFNSSPGVVFNTPERPTAGLAFSIGGQADKMISNELKFGVGIGYSNFSTHTMVGDAVDSVASINFRGNKSLSPEKVFKTGNAMRFTNKIGLLEIPLTLSYAPLKKIPVTLEAGVVPGYVIQADVLVFDYAKGVYFTNNAVYNRFSLSAQTGLNIDLEKLINIPVSLGYRYSFQATSVIKQEFGKQHITNSGVLIKFRL